jgi:hypothetical protein
MVPMQGYSCELKMPSEAQVLGLFTVSVILLFGNRHSWPERNEGLDCFWLPLTPCGLKPAVMKL